MKNKKGSILAYSLIIIAMMLAIAGSLSVSSVLEKKSASVTEFSMQSLQTADGGAQLALKKINVELAKATPGNLSAAMGACVGGKFTSTNDGSAGPVDSYYELTFLKKDGVTQVQCNEPVSLITNIKSIGTYKNTVRAVDVSVAPLVLPCSASTSTDSFCSFAGLIYGTITGMDGRIWLDRNLGAKKVASTHSDVDSYGWLFQWGRKADNHQYTAWGGQTGAGQPALSSAVAVSSGSSTVAPPNNEKFLKYSILPRDWRIPQVSTLWDGVSAVNNPCPPGFRLPTGGVYTAPGADGLGEWANLVTKSGITSYSNAASSALRLPAAGYRSYTDTLSSQGTSGFYWSGTPGTGVNAIYSYEIQFNASVSSAALGYRADGLSVRCIKN